MDNDVREISEILDTVSSKIPPLINSLMDTLYSPEAGKKMGQAVGALYRELVDAGIPAEDALAMAKEYMISIKNVVNSGNNKSE